MQAGKLLDVGVIGQGKWVLLKERGLGFVKAEGQYPAQMEEEAVLHPMI